MVVWLLIPAAAAVAAIGAVFTGYQTYRGAKDVSETVNKASKECDKRKDEAAEMAKRIVSVKDSAFEIWTEIQGAWEEWHPHLNKIKDTLKKLRTVINSVTGDIFSWNCLVVYMVLCAAGYIFQWCLDIGSLNQIFRNTTILTLAVVYVHQQRSWTHDVVLFVATLGVPAIITIVETIQFGLIQFGMGILKLSLLLLLFGILLYFIFRKLQCYRHSAMTTS